MQKVDQNIKLTNLESYYKYKRLATNERINKVTQEFKVGDRVRDEVCGMRGVIKKIIDGKQGHFMAVMVDDFGDEWTILYHQLEKEFKIGDKVRKVSGYQYPGVVVAVFRNLKGDDRYVVECTVPEVAGMLHIYNCNQLEKVEG